MPWFRRRSDYGRVLPRHQWQGVSRSRRAWNALKWWLGAMLIAGLAWYYLGAVGRIGPPTMPPGPSERIDAKFTRCGPQRAENCVVDGDTIKLGARAVRIIGIDAPEIHPARCPDEQAKGDASVELLLAMVNAGPFTLAGPYPPVHDQFGRELRHLLRARADGSVQSIADDMVAAGLARPYLNGSRNPWCYAQ